MIEDLRGWLAEPGRRRHRVAALGELLGALGLVLLAEDLARELDEGDLARWARRRFTLNTLPRARTRAAELGLPRSVFVALDEIRGEGADEGLGRPGVR